MDILKFKQKLCFQMMCANSPRLLSAKRNWCEGHIWPPGQTLGAPAFVAAPEDTFNESVDTQIKNSLVS